jgi:hypothetical protein
MLTPPDCFPSAKLLNSKVSAHGILWLEAPSTESIGAMSQTTSILQGRSTLNGFRLNVMAWMCLHQGSLSNGQAPKKSFQVHHFYTEFDSETKSGLCVILANNIRKEAKHPLYTIYRALLSCRLCT